MLVSVLTQGPGIPDKPHLCRHLSKDNRHNASTNSYVDKGKIVPRGHCECPPTLLSEPTLPLPFPRTSCARPRSHPTCFPLPPKPTLPRLSSHPCVCARPHPTAETYPTPSFLVPLVRGRALTLPVFPCCLNVPYPSFLVPLGCACTLTLAVFPTA
jgi:hypothetical protein